MTPLNQPPDRGRNRAPGTDRNNTDAQHTDEQHTYDGFSNGASGGSADGTTEAAFSTHIRDNTVNNSPTGGPTHADRGVRPDLRSALNAGSGPDGVGRVSAARRTSSRAKRFIIAGIVAVLVAGTVWLLISRHKTSTAAATSSGNMAGMPGMSSSGSGTQGGSMAGMAGMDVTGNGSVKLTASQIHQFGITFGTAEVRPLTSETRTTGVVTFDETKMAQIAPKFGGFVERLYVNSTGQQVQRGQPVLDIYSPELVAAEQELLLAGQVDRSIGKSSVPGMPAGQTDLADASRRRLRLWDISDAQIDQILRTGRVRRTLTLYAPVSGIVVDKKVLQGQAVTSGEELYIIANLSDVWVDAQLREVDAASVRVGSLADIQFAGLPGRTYKGRVAYVYPTLQSEARTIKARIVVPNTDGMLKPGMYATVRLSTPSRSALTVPNSAILQTGDRNIVFVDMGNGELMPHEVELGRVAGDYTEILSGLEAGQRVVTSAQFLLDSESNLGEVMKSMIGMGSGGGGQSMQNMPGMDMSGSKGPAPASGNAPSAGSANTDMNDKGADVKSIQNMQNMPGMQMSSPTKPTAKAQPTPRR
ncbi:MAG: efflux RND transporter periplasmic adaptor subunit [Gemmatimonadaceae bacterium]